MASLLNSLKSPGSALLRLFRSARNWFRQIAVLRLRMSGAKVGSNVTLVSPSNIYVDRSARCVIGSNVILNSNIRIAVFPGGSLTIGDGVTINDFCILECRGNLFIGKNTLLNTGTIIYCSDSVHVGDDVLIAPYVLIGDVEHSVEDTGVPIRSQPNPPPEPVFIGNGAWLCTKVTVTMGVTIGEGAVIAANAVVTKDIPPKMIAAGLPAKVIRARPIAREK